MRRKNKESVIYAFIDSQNLNLGIRDAGWKLDFAKFFLHLKHKYRIKKAFLFIGYVPGNESIYTYLQNSGYTLIFKPTITRLNHNRTSVTKGNVDAELVLHSMIQFGNYDRAIIVSGDGDFYCLIEYLENKDKLLKVLIPNSKKFSALLKKFRPRFEFVNWHKTKLEMKQKRGSEPRN